MPSGTGTPAVLTRGDRFILRAYSPPITIGGGIVLDPHAPRTGVRTTSARRTIRAAARGTPAPSAGRSCARALRRGARTGWLERTALTCGRGHRAPRRACRHRTPACGGAGRGYPGDVFARGSRGARDASEALVGSITPRTRCREGSRARKPANGSSRRRARVVRPGPRRPVGGGQGRWGASGFRRRALASLSPRESRPVTPSNATSARGAEAAEPAAIAASHGIAADVIERVIALLVRQKVAVKIRGSISTRRRSIA